MGLLGPFIDTKSGNTHLLVITDRFTKLKRTVPLVRTREFEVANDFAKYWAFVYGAPSSLLADNGPPFNTKFYQEICNQMGINFLFTTTYRPQANGQAERFNRTISSALRSNVSDHSPFWDVYYDTVTIYYNSQRHATAASIPSSIAKPYNFTAGHRASGSAGRKCKPSGS